MTVPQIEALSPPPVRANAEADFDSRADAFLAALPPFGEQANGLATYVNGRAMDAANSASASANSAGSAEQAKASAELARDAAQAVASFKGSWAGLAGALNLPATVLHNGQIWSLLANLAEVAASEPGVTGDWVVQGGLDASKVVSFTASRNARYWLPATITVTLPATAGMPIGTFVELSKAQLAEPVIQTTDGATILFTGLADTSMKFNLNARLLVVWSGTAWEV